MYSAKMQRRAFKDAYASHREGGSTCMHWARVFVLCLQEMYVSNKDCQKHASEWLPPRHDHQLGPSQKLFQDGI